jgi:hypothetical protein
MSVLSFYRTTDLFALDIFKKDLVKHQLIEKIIGDVPAGRKKTGRCLLFHCQTALKSFTLTNCCQFASTKEKL